MNEPSIWREVFSPVAQAIAFFGGLGGFAHALALRRPWRDTIRITAIGCITAFGFGVASSQIMRVWLPDLPEGAAGSLGTLSSGAFLVGIVGVFLIERLLDRFTKKGDEQ